MACERPRHLWVQKLELLTTGRRDASNAETQVPLKLGFPEVKVLWPAQHISQENQPFALVAVVSGLDSHVVRAGIWARARTDNSVSQSEEAA